MSLAPRPVRPCADGCGEPALRGSSRCAAHARAAREQHNRGHAAYHTVEYRRVRSEQLARHPTCCLDIAASACNGVLTIHHVNHDATDNRPRNRVTVCERHHMRLEREYQLAGSGALHEALEIALTVLLRTDPAMAP